MDIPASPAPLTSAIVSDVVEAVRAGTLFTAAGGITALQIGLGGYVGMYASALVTTPSLKLASGYEISALGISALAFSGLRSAIGYEGESMGKNFGYALAVSAPPAIVQGYMLRSYGKSRIADIALYAGLSNTVPDFPSEPNFDMPFRFPAMNPGCGTQGQLAAGSGTIPACRVPRLAHQGTMPV